MDFVDEVNKARALLKGIISKTPLIRHNALSEKNNGEVFFKREDLQLTRSYKVRGAFNAIALLESDKKQAGIVCASAGNHAQGVAFACNKLGINGKIFMPLTTPEQKIVRTRKLGSDKIEIVLEGDTFDDASRSAREYAEKNKMAFIHPFDDKNVIAGQGTVGAEILEEIQGPLDYIVVPIGGGGLISGVGAYIKQKSPKTIVFGVEPSGASSMYESFKQGKIVELEKIDTFVDGAAVRKPGKLTFEIAQRVVDDILLIDEGKVCMTMIELYQDDGITAEPAGALSIAALDQLGSRIVGKRGVCILSGGNNDLERMADVKMRSFLYQGLEHYFIVYFPQRPGALKEFLSVLGPDDDIIHFAYTKKTSRESGPALIGVRLKKQDDYSALVRRMNSSGIKYETVNDKQALFELLV